MSPEVHVLTLNMHKGFSHLNTRFVLHELREAIRSISADLVFLQEVQGEHVEKADLHPEWPDEAQYEFLADEIWTDFAYGKNAIYESGHHGNAVLSKYPIIEYKKEDISTNFIEQRGLLWCKVDLTEGRVLHCLNVHLGLSAVSRRKQLAMIADFVDDEIPYDEPIVLAGDFNDWSGFPTKKFSETMGFREVFLETQGDYARSYPAKLPVLKLDKILVRGLSITHTEVLSNGVWSDLSDHAALFADLRIS